MTMDRFTEAYDQLRSEVVTKAHYEKEWQAFLKTDIAPILASSGPIATHALLKNNR